MKGQCMLIYLDELNSVNVRVLCNFLLLKIYKYYLINNKLLCKQCLYLHHIHANAQTHVCTRIHDCYLLHCVTGNPAIRESRNQYAVEKTRLREICCRLFL